MGHDLAFRTGLAAGLGLIAAAGNLVGGYFVVHKEWPRKFLQYFLALGAGYMLAVAFVEVIPESVQLSGESALLYVLMATSSCTCLNIRCRHIFILVRRRISKR